MKQNIMIWFQKANGNNIIPNNLTFYSTNLIFTLGIVRSPASSKGENEADCVQIMEIYINCTYDGAMYKFLLNLLCFSCWKGINEAIPVDIQMTETDRRYELCEQTTTVYALVDISLS